MGIQKTALEGSILSKNRPPQINFETVNLFALFYKYVILHSKEFFLD